jgi:hypothetical protein
LSEISNLYFFKCNELSLLSVNFVQQVVQHCGDATMHNLVDFYNHVLPPDTDVRILDEDQVEVGMEVALKSLANATDSGSKGKLPVLLWIVEDTWDPMPENGATDALSTPSADQTEHL